MADLYRWFHSTWHGAENGRLRIAVSNSAPQRVSDDYFAFLSEFSREHDLPFNIHLLETKTQRVLGQSALGQIADPPCARSRIPRRARDGDPRDLGRR